MLKFKGARLKYKGRRHCTILITPAHKHSYKNVKTSLQKQTSWLDISFKSTLVEIHIYNFLHVMAPL
jgi:hypothetical protein